MTESRNSRNGCQGGGEAPLSSKAASGEGPLFARCKTRVGSPMYVAREIVSRDFCRDGYDGTAVDVWSMGVMLYVPFSTLPPPPPFTLFFGEIR